MTIRDPYGRTLAENKNNENRYAERFAKIANNASKTLTPLGDVATYLVPRRGTGNRLTLYVNPDVNVHYALTRINKRLKTDLTLNDTAEVKFSRITVAVTVRMGKRKRNRRAA